MGYTHYWDINPKTNEAKYKKALKDCVKIVEHGTKKGILAGWDGTGKPEIKNGLRFNGKAPEDYETFSLPGKPMDVFNFCKTAQRPYDIYVTACLATMRKHLGKDFKISSDGGEEAFKEGQEFANQILGKNVLQMKKNESKGLVSKWRNGTVLWFDELSGEGMIKAEDGNVYSVYETAIESRNSVKTLNEKDKVKFKTIGDSTFTQIFKVKEDSKESKRISSKSKEVVLYEWFIDKLQKYNTIQLKTKNKNFDEFYQHYGHIEISYDNFNVSIANPEEINFLKSFKNLESAVNFCEKELIKAFNEDPKNKNYKIVISRKVREK